MLIKHPVDMESVFHLIYETLKLPLAFIKSDGEVQLTVPYQPMASFAYPDSSQLLEQLRLQCLSAARPAIRVLMNTESYILVRLKDQQGWSGTLVAGPVVQYDVSGATIDSFLTAHQIPRKHKNEVLRYYSKLPVMTYSKIQHSALLLYYLVYGERLDLDALTEHDNEARTAGRENVDQVLESSLSVNRQREFYHHSYSAQSAIFNCVRDGDANRLRKVLNASLDGERGVLCAVNPLRNQKNFAICGVALATRSAIEGGLDSEVAFTLSDQYIQQIEDLTDIHQVAHKHHRMLYDFAELVYKVQNSTVSYVVRQCKSYISAHLLKDIDYNVLAQHLKMNKYYIAEVFKQETKLSVGDYIQKERIEEAKRMLVKNEHALLDIAFMLRFYDQSHFTRAFKKWCGITPKQYQIRANS